jgi:O-antigen/teichoic acid export membrane protein
MNLFALLPERIASHLDRRPIAQRLARGAFWTLAGSLAVRALSIPVSVMLARYMGPSHYGELGIIYSSIDLFTIFAGFGLGLTAIKHTAEYRQKDPDRAGRILALSTATAVLTGGLFAVLLYVLAPWLARHTLAAPHLTSSLRVASLLLFFTAINGAQSGALYGFEAFKVSARIQAITGLANIPLMVGGYFAGGVNGVLWGVVGTRFLDYMLRAGALRAEACRNQIRISYSHCSQELGVLWSFSLPAVLAGAMVGPVTWLCNTMLVRQPNGYREMGIYNIASTWYGALLFLPVALGSALLPLLSERLGQNDRRSSAKVLSMMLCLNGAIAVPAAVAITLASPYIMRWYGPAYNHAAPVLAVVSFTAAFCAIHTPAGSVLDASGRMWILLAMNAGWAIVVLTTTSLLVHLGAMGLATARLIAYILHAGWVLVFAARLTGSGPRQWIQSLTRSSLSARDTLCPSEPPHPPALERVV